MFLLWPAVMFSIVRLMWFFETRFPAALLPCLVLLIWVMFFRAWRDGLRIRAFRCPQCGERFFYKKVGWIFEYGNIWSNKCVHCGHRVT